MKIRRQIRIILSYVALYRVHKKIHLAINQHISNIYGKKKRKKCEIEIENLMKALSISFNTVALLCQQINTKKLYIGCHLL